MPDSQFPHINLLFVQSGMAKLEGGGSANPLVQGNKNNRPNHSSFLLGKVNNLSRRAREVLQTRSREIKGGVPFLIQIPEDDDGAIEFVAEKLGLEVVAEYDEGFLIVASEDIDLQKVIQLVNEFAQSKRGSGSMAKILDVVDDPASPLRLNRILDERLLPKWPFPDDEEFILDVSIEVAAFGAPSKPRISSRTKPETKEKKQVKYDADKARFHQDWDERRLSRENEIERFVQSYQGEICRIVDDSHVVEFPDSFSARLRMKGKGFKDLIMNYPNLFEVVLPDDVFQPAGNDVASKSDDYDFRISPPLAGSPSICVIDSGIQEQHRWLINAIDTTVSRCFIPGKELNDIADLVKGGGHGTRVAGACLFPQSVPRSGVHQALFWLLNARVLDEDNRLLAKLFPADLLRKIVSHYKGLKGTRIYQHSICSEHCCRLNRMSIWASAIDLLSYQEDVLFVQAAGNLDSGPSTSICILNHLQQGKTYPGYLYEASSRIANPAQSLQALTVGSIAIEAYRDQNKKSFAAVAEPSAFSRSGFGMWDSIKPEVVEFGGDYVADTGVPPLLTTPPAVCPELIRSTLHGGPLMDRDKIGTSFAAPKIAHIAGRLAVLFPTHTTLLYRALIVNSARWPTWAEQARVEERPQIVRSIGYGLPSLSRAIENTEQRITLITEKTYPIKAKEGYVFGVPIPDELRRPGDDFDVRIDVTLSYAARPRRTRKSRRGYLAVWLDWKTSKKSEDFDSFQARALKENDGGEGADDGNFSWTLGNKKERDGVTSGVSRRNGTIQKDWAFAKSYELPDVFGIVVRGHEGWDRNNPEAVAKFSLAISFEILGSNINVYERIQAVNRIQVETPVEIKAR